MILPLLNLRTRIIPIDCNAQRNYLTHLVKQSACKELIEPADRQSGFYVPPNTLAVNMIRWFPAKAGLQVSPINWTLYLQDFQFLIVTWFSSAISCPSFRSCQKLSNMEWKYDSLDTRLSGFFQPGTLNSEPFNLSQHRCAHANWQLSAHFRWA